MNPTERFSGRAGDYVAGRPSYPADAIDALLADLGEPSSLTVADIGAGTGISSRLLGDRGVRVIAVEPNTSMREHAANHARVTWQNGTAEATGLVDSSANLVVAFQAFHWFRYGEAIREMGRIVKPHGRVALVYNERDDQNAFTRGYDAIVRGYATDKTEPKRHDGRSIFEGFAGWSAVTRHAFPNAQRFGRAGMHARAGSTSYLPKDGATGVALRTALDDLFDACESGDTVDLLMKTIVIIATPHERPGPT